MVLSIIVPTYEESENIRPLCERIFKTMKKSNIEAEVIIVDDDSGADTIKTDKIVKSLKSEGYNNLNLYIRRKSEGKGLSSAVLKGFELAKYVNILCMDADLQHEPESIPNIANPIINKKVEFTVGSRLTEGGKVQGWTTFRKIISWGATILARPLTPCKDPMSGFFVHERTSWPEENQI
eukprot:UN34427